MTKVKHTPASLRRRKKTLKGVKGHYGARSRSLRVAKDALRKSMIDAYIGRKRKKREYRSLWIVRINAACEEAGLSYSKFMGALKKANINLNRKVLAEIAANDAKAFKALVAKVK